ncbi:MAG TPA: methyltransferase domain-containing protein [Candidatus Saccharimonadales bacterium]|nr:methyltransferase domain-containing protein [Candidatus Saccharimonadales bacterium]
MSAKASSKMTPSRIKKPGHTENLPTIDNEFTLYSYVGEDGEFDYERYRSIQEEGNKRKIDKVWVLEKNIAYIADYLKNRLGQVSFGICHGTRRGLEQEWFSEYLGAEVLGTEISETATQFPHTIQWDFHEVKPEWLEKADFIYSNSFDHSYDPDKCLNAWMSCVRPGGLCIIEHSDGHHPSGTNQLDPFGAHLVQMPYLITKWGKGRFGVREILSAPAKKKELQYTAFIVIQKFEETPRARPRFHKDKKPIKGSF